MVYAQIKNGVVENTIVLDDLSIYGLFLTGYDHLIRIDEMVPQPGIGWLYDGNGFTYVKDAD